LNTSMNPKIPFIDLITPHRDLEDELVSVFRSALMTAGFIGGPMVEEFEREFAAFCGTKYCVGVGSGTDALRFILIAAGVSPGDTVLTVPNTFIATTEAISQAGATPDFIDIDEHTCNMDTEKLRVYLEGYCRWDNTRGVPLSKRTGSPVTAVIPVHLYGQIADMDPILDLAERYNLMVIEDACQAHGAEYFSRRESLWRNAGSLGIAAAFSFYPGKNLGACGEAGAVTTNDERIDQGIRMLRDHGQSRKYFHDIQGYNGRLDAIQAGILMVKLRHLGQWNESRRQAAQRYNELLKDIDGVVTPFEPDWSKAVYHLYVIRIDDRDGLKKSLSSHAIDTGLHYPLPLHLQKAYTQMGYQAGDFPLAERVSSEILSLPMFPGITPEQQERVAEVIRLARVTGQKT
jgi:dTDP-4-amino-4,6-dideoxygalactose transaminase